MIPPRGAPAFRCAALLLAAALLPGCPAKDPDAAPGGGAGVKAPAPAPAAPSIDPAVKAALAARPDLARNRVMVLGLDGCDPQIVKELAAAGRLPNFARLIAGGAWGPLTSQAPMLSPLLWTSVATGKFPTEHGVLDFMVGSRDDPEKRETVTSRHRQVEAMWDIAGRYGRTVSVVGWLASHPAEEVNGVAVSERTELLAYLFNQKIAPSDAGKTWPPDLLAKIQPLRRRPSDIPYAEVKPFLAISEEEYRLVCQKDEFTNDNRSNNLRLMLAGADNFRRIGASLRRDRKPALDCRYFELLDAVCHNFMAYREPITWKPRELKEVQQAYKDADPPVDPAVIAEFKKDLEEEARKFVSSYFAGLPPQRLAEIQELLRGAEPDKVAKWKGAVDAAYEWTDRLLGEAMAEAEADADTVLFVLSDHGFASGERKPPFDSSFNSKLGGASYHLPGGVLGIWGKGVRKGFAIPAYAKGQERGARLVDVAPTVLALMGFPKAKDMPGRVLTEIFELDLAVGTTDTYESGRSARLAREGAASRGGKGSQDPVEDEEIEDVTRQLTAVGYLGTAEEGPIRALLHMAASYEQQGRFEEAEEALREALKSAKGPRRRQVWAGIGKNLLRRGDLDGALRVYEESLREAPKDPLAAWVGIAMIHAAKGNVAAQVDSWERIVARFPEPAYRIRLADALRMRAAARGGPTAGADLARARDLILDAVRPEGGGEPDYAKLEAGGRNTLGMVLLDGGDFEGAMRHFKAASERNPEYVKPRNNLAVLHMRLAGTTLAAADPEADPARRAALEKQAAGHRAEALRWFGEVLDIDPENAKAHCNRAEVLMRLPPEDPKAAEADLEKAIQYDPNYRRARMLLEELRAGRPKSPPAPRKTPR